jgi:hypothetical protein
MLTHPRYFVAVFGDPQPPHKDVVESGVYYPNAKYAPFPVEPGDVMLPYCTGSYAQHQIEVPGLGVVLSTDNQSVSIGRIFNTDGWPSSRTPAPGIPERPIYSSRGLLT